MVLRSELIDSLKKLKEVYGVVAIKAEFEAEGSRKDELIMLGEMIEQAELGFIIKIGGCEAVHDLDQCKLLGATGVMAPMIETPFAMSKFRGAVKKVYGDQPGVERIINAETITCFHNYDEILKAADGFLTGVTVGCSDLSASMGIERKDIECDKVFETTKVFAQKGKEHGLITNFGGNIGVESIPFVIRMYDYIDRFETRKVVLTKSRDPEFLKAAIGAALSFELQYLTFKSEYYKAMADEDAARIRRMQNQLNRIED